MRKSSAIKWEESPKVLTILDFYQIRFFEKYFLGEYIRDNYLTDTINGLNNFLKSLTRQELEIFLSLKGGFGRSYITDKLFIEILNYCLIRTNLEIQRLILFAIIFIIERHELSREKLIENSKNIEKIANTESILNGLALQILKILDADYNPPVIKQYIVKPNQKYEFYKNFREIIKNASNYIYFVDNYANHMIFDYIYTSCDMSKISEIKIISLKNIDDLKLAKQTFEAQYSGIDIEIKKSDEYHDRYLFFDNEQWFLGPSIKDGGKKACSIVQLKDKEGNDALNIFNQIWEKATIV